MFDMPPSSVARLFMGAATGVLLAGCAPDGAPAESGDARAALVPATPAEARSAADTARVVLYGVDLTGVGHDLGDPSAPVTVVEFSDFGCPFCAMYGRETFPALREEFIETGKVFYKYVPFVMGMFPNGEEAALAAECAPDERTFWRMHDRLYEEQRAWKGARDPEALFVRLAADAGLDRAAFARCYDRNGSGERVAASTEAARLLRIRATPTFFINGQVVEGALPLAQFREALIRMGAGE